MSSAGTIYREHVNPTVATGPGQKSVYLDIDNDGVIISLQRVSGDASVTAKLYSELPGVLGSFFVDQVAVQNDLPVQGAYVTLRRIRVDFTWDDTVSFTLVTKQASGSAITAFREQIAAPDTDTPVFRQTTTSGIHRLLETQEMIINHLRQITEINDEHGDVF
jgi:hypothetical protein